MAYNYRDYKPNLSEEDLEKLVKQEAKRIKKLKAEYSEDSFCRIVACVFVLSKQQELQILEYENIIKDAEFAMGIFSSNVVAHTQEARDAMLEMAAEAEITAAKSLVKGMNLAKVAQARRGAKAKLAKDPKQADKSFVKDCWLEWQRNADRYNGKAAFARDMLSKCENLISQKKIEDWCRGWEKETAPS
jgi:hypothetical protein